MEKVQLDIDEQLKSRINSLQQENESIEDTIKRVLMMYHPIIGNKEWSKNTKTIFDEFEDTF